MGHPATRHSSAPAQFRLDRPIGRGPALVWNALVTPPGPGRGPAGHRRIRAHLIRRSGMRRLLLGFLAPCALFAALAGSAAAAVHVRIAVSPSVIPQCGEGHGILVVGNDGTSPILARVCFALTRNDTTLLGPSCRS